MATYTVTTLEDSASQGSLRHAISSIPASSTEAYTIVFEDSLEGSVKLSSSRLYRLVSAGRDNVFIDAFLSDGTPRFIGIENDEDSALDGRVILLLFRNISCRFRGIIFNGGYDTASTSAGGVSIEATSSYTGQVDAVFDNCIFHSCYDTSNGACYVKHRATYNNCLFYGCYCGQTGSSFKGLVNSDDGTVVFNDCTIVNNTLAQDSSLVVGFKANSTGTIEYNNTIVSFDDETENFSYIPAPYNAESHAANPDLPRSDIAALRLYPTLDSKWGVGERINSEDLVGHTSPWPTTPMGCYAIYGAVTKDVEVDGRFLYIDLPVSGFVHSFTVKNHGVLSISNLTVQDWNGEQTPVYSASDNSTVDSVSTICCQGSPLPVSSGKLVQSVFAEFGIAELETFEFQSNTVIKMNMKISATKGDAPCIDFAYTGERYRIGPISVNSIVSNISIGGGGYGSVEGLLFDGYHWKSKVANRTLYYIGDSKEGSFTNQNDWSLTQGGDAIDQPVLQYKTTFVVDTTT